MLTASNIVRPALRLVALLALTVASAHATTFDYSYKFQDGQVINGTFTGTANGNLITNIGDVTGQISGVGPNAGYVFQDLMAGSYDSSGISETGAIVDINGQHSNFFFTNSVADSSATNWFYISDLNTQTGQLEQARLAGNIYLDYDNRYYNSENFSVIAEANTGPNNVPEPTSIALLGIALSGLAASRRKAKSSKSA